MFVLYDYRPGQTNHSSWNRGTSSRKIVQVPIICMYRHVYVGICRYSRPPLSVVGLRRQRCPVTLDCDGIMMGSIPTIIKARNVPLLLCHALWTCAQHLEDKVLKYKHILTYTAEIPTPTFQYRHIPTALFLGILSLLCVSPSRMPASIELSIKLVVCFCVSIMSVSCRSRYLLVL